ncbi:hypothetical protein GDO78_008023 [Eleutherodactylus coqui]|uniref:Uncharacterized protein n=1 Tax=Eleutherodactylus coqui TaxID=57060 RepID=A0A8J6FBR3_ELECQ|nr:hypothetical protein GDO78_008023 [Eleutherodactylus coqui]
MVSGIISLGLGARSHNRFVPERYTPSPCLIYTNMAHLRALHFTDTKWDIDRIFFFPQESHIPVKHTLCIASDYNWAVCGPLKFYEQHTTVIC